jgi:hypothetical protein
LKTDKKLDDRPNIEMALRITGSENRRWLEQLGTLPSVGFGTSAVKCPLDFNFTAGRVLPASYIVF